MRGRQTGREQLLKALKAELKFFDSRGYGYPFRSEWRPTLLLRDSPVCINYSATGRRHECRDCPMFSLVPSLERSTVVPCHHIPLDAAGNTIAEIYRMGTQRELDLRYRDWLRGLILEFERH